MVLFFFALLVVMYHVAQEIVNSGSISRPGTSSSIEMEPSQLKYMKANTRPVRSRRSPYIGVIMKGTR